ncbi:hypothetical protein [uncultured Sphingobacterium sp.]
MIEKGLNDGYLSCTIKNLVKDHLIVKTISATDKRISYYLILLLS